MARNQPDDFSDDPGYSESGSHSGSGGSGPATYSTSSPSSPAAHGTLGANGLTSADMDLSGMGEGVNADPPAQEAASAPQKSATRTSTRSGTSGDAPSPTSMAKKRSNQPR